MAKSETKALARRLNSLSPARRRAALDQIRELPRNQAVKIVARLASVRPIARMYSSKEVMMKGALGLFAVILTIIIAPQTAYGDLLRETALALYFAGMAHVAFNLIAKYRSPWVYPLLNEYQDGRLVAPALKVLRYPYKPNSSYVEASLAVNLPLMTEKQGKALSSVDIVTLRDLTRSRLPELRIEAARALACLGDLESISVIDKMVKREASQDVRMEAQASLQQLINLKNDQIAGRTLMRAADCPSESDNLLRVALPAVKVEEAQLLRPVATDGEKPISLTTASFPQESTVVTVNLTSE